MRSIKLRGSPSLLVFLQGREHGCYSEIPSPGTAPHLYQGLFRVCGAFSFAAVAGCAVKSKASTMGAWWRPMANPVGGASGGIGTGFALVNVA
jgi:hypothetical protein